MKKFFIFIFCFTSFLVFSNNQGFKSLLKKMDIEFKKPKNYKEIDFVDQYNVKYHIGLKHKTEKIELRISLIPDRKEKIKKGKNTEEVDFAMSLLLTILNITQNENYDPKLKPFKDKDVKKEFNADRGFTCILEGESDFIGDYKKVMMNTFYKKDSGTIHVFILSDDLQKAFTMKDFAEVFYCVRFK